MKHYALAALATSLMLSACATTEGYRQQTEQYIGQTSDMLVIELGPPLRRHALSDDSEVWVYQFEEYRYIPGHHYTVPVERRVTYRDSDGYRRERKEVIEDVVYEPPRDYWAPCETRFVISPDGYVRDFRFEGEACRAPERR
ncbi:hypothetical protein [Woodsholea maritima]|uniref:hypothetical protein n=1 Tax=Woodsholea maritima TaxID=240237 RepID=UPI000378FB27|nr:hypothetical protein [Woodsholea maritima]